MNSKHFLIYLIFALVFYWLINPYYESIHPDNEVISGVKIEEIDSTITVGFSAVGDLMCHSTQFNYAWVEKDSFDFDPVFSVIGDYLRGKDILIGNLETVLAGDTKNYLGYPFFNTPNEFASALKNAGFDFLTTANNHANDQGFDGAKRTLDILREINIIPLGTSSLDSVKNYNVFVRKGLRFGMLAYTYGTNYNQDALNPRSYINHIDTAKIKNEVNSLKSKGVDIVIVLFHFGNQYEKQISAYQESIVAKTFDYGADIILGSHPHIIQKFEKKYAPNSSLDSGLVIYSLGNFVSNQRWRYSDGGVIFNFDITKNIYTDSVYVSDISFLPIWVFKGITDLGKEYIVLPANQYNSGKYEYLTEADIDSMKKSYYDTIAQLKLNTNKLKIDHHFDID